MAPEPGPGSGGADVPPGGGDAPATVQVPGTIEQEAVTPGRQAGPDVDPPRPAPEPRVPGAPREEPEVAPGREGEPSP